MLCLTSWLSQLWPSVQKHVLKDTWLPLTDDDAMRMIHLLDRNGDNKVDYNEFRRFVYLLPESQVSFVRICHQALDAVPSLASSACCCSLWPAVSTYSCPC